MEIEVELGGVEVEVKIAGARGAATLLGLSALAAAVVKELRRPPDARRWHGTLLGVVPYDLRPPTATRLRAALWDRSNPDVLVPTAFGVGWTVNIAALAGRCGCLPAGADETTPTTEPAPQVSA
jgi:hypothetical protein